MYLNHFNLNKQPFNITPDPALLYLSHSHKEALAAAIYGVAERKGFIAIIGEVGVGKTTIVRTFLDRIDKHRIRIIHLFNPNISFRELLEVIFQELDLVPESADVSKMVNQMHHILISLYREGINVVLVIDEAQNMPVATLQNLHMLSNLETATAKLIQVIFSGQPELEEKLSTPPLRQLKQRLAIKVRIQPLNRKESEDYIAHRLTRVAGNVREIFASGAIRLITDKAAGIPRMINILCDNCLITAFGRRQPKVSIGIAREIIADMEGREVHSRWRIPALVSLFLAAGALWFHQKPDPPAVVPSVMPLPTSPSVVEAKLSVPREDIQPEAHHPVAKTDTPRQRQAKKKTRSPQKKAASSRSFLKGSVPVHKWVREGDTLPGLVLENYGTVDQALLDLVRHNNPHIPDMNHLQGGERMYFPSRQH